MIVDKVSGWVFATGYNDAVSTCCDGWCVRDSLNIKHGTNTDAGAEIHAEQAALLNLTTKNIPMRIYVAGLDKEQNPLNGFDSSPCYSCARMLAYVGIEDVYLPVDGTWERFDIRDIMETWEKSWGATDA
jgi:deoxycytidylate deaminase